MSFGTRSHVWQSIISATDWELVVIGGGITGAGILREAARAGLRALLVEAKDFAWGTSSRSSKMVHGGLRYLKQFQLGTTFHSVREREQLLKAGEGLITPLPFLMPIYDASDKLMYQLGLSVYDLMAARWDHRQYTADEIALLIPRLNRDGLNGGFSTEDAQTDDARLVLRVLQEAISAGGTAINYARADRLIQDESGVRGVTIRDVETGATADIRARVVMNASGAWVDQLRAQVGGESRIRPLRGSHLLFPAWRFPVAQAISFLHPADRRPVFVYPWEGVTLVGTTDIDHPDDLNDEPHISGAEVAYLLAACHAQFPSVNVEATDILSTFAGVRPVIGTGKTDPSKEARDHVIMVENGLISVTGGKLTTFRLIALDALRAAAPFFESALVLDEKSPPLDPLAQMDEMPALSTDRAHRLRGRYGALTADLPTDPDLLTPVGETRTLWAELRYAAEREAVVHLDDLLLRRTRIGLLLPNGGAEVLEHVQAVCTPVLNWHAARWQAERARYLALWLDRYSVPTNIPDWRGYLGSTQVQVKKPRRVYRVVAAASVIAAAAVMIPRIRRRARNN